jgi:hypothetical protein
MRLDAAGAAITIDPYSTAAAADLATHVISCAHGERPLAPGYGLADPLTGGVSAGSIAAALEVCEPEIALQSATVNQAGPGRVAVQAIVHWSQA